MIISNSSLTRVVILVPPVLLAQAVQIVSEKQAEPLHVAQSVIEDLIMRLEEEPVTDESKVITAELKALSRTQGASLFFTKNIPGGEK